MNERMLDSLYHSAAIFYAMRSVGNKEAQKADPANIGNTICGAFIVDLRCALIAAAEIKPSATVTLPWIGDFEVKGASITFNPSTELKNSAAQESNQPSKLLELLSTYETLIDMSIVGNEKLHLQKCHADTLAEFFRWNPRIPGQEYLKQVFAIIAEARMVKDPLLNNSLKLFYESEDVRSQSSEAITNIACLAIYDGISCGAELYLETIGKFYHDLDFCPDINLQRSLSLTYRLRNVPPKKFATSF